MCDVKRGKRPAETFGESGGKSILLGATVPIPLRISTARGFIKSEDRRGPDLKAFFDELRAQKGPGLPLRAE